MENMQRETDFLLNKDKSNKIEEYHSVNNRAEIRKQATYDDDDGYYDCDEKQSGKQSRCSDTQRGPRCLPSRVSPT